MCVNKATRGALWKAAIVRNIGFLRFLQLFSWKNLCQKNDGARASSFCFFFLLLGFWCCFFKRYCSQGLWELPGSVTYQSLEFPYILVYWLELTEQLFEMQSDVFFNHFELFSEEASDFFQWHWHRMLEDHAMIVVKSCWCVDIFAFHNKCTSKDDITYHGM